MPPKGKPTKTGSTRRANKTKKDDDENTEWDMGDDLMAGGKQLVKPEDQLELNEKQLKEEFTRILTANNPHAPQNIVRFSFKEGTFKQTSAVEQIAIHFALDGNMLHKDSDEARRQKAGGKSVEIELEPEPEPEPEKPKAEAVKPEGEEGEGGEKPPEDEAGGEGGEEKKKEPEEEEEAAEAPKKKGTLRNQFNYSERASQTFNNPYRQRGTETEPPPRATFSATANQWMIFDAYQADLLKAKLAKEKASKSTSTFRKDDDKNRKKKLPTMEIGGDNINRVVNAAKILERMVNQNTYDDISQDFAYFEDASDEFRDTEGTLLPLWKFSYDKAKRQSVTALKWSPTYPDLFAVGLGSYEFLRQGTGMLLFYSLKNPTFPEHIYTTVSGIMSIDIHPDQPYLVATGFYDGSVAVYNILEKTSDPIFSSTAKSGKHTDPVFEVKWHGNDLDGNRNFFSASADGRVGCWTLVKDELIFTEMITLKIQSGAAGPDGTQLQILGCAISLAFHRDIDYLYLVGTEKGRIHKCSKAYSTHFLDTFMAHNMAVNTISWNPFHADIFITCSADWTVKIWDINYTVPMFIFDLLSPVGDVAWAPYSSTVFAAVTNYGQCFVFDLNVNKYEALCEQTVVQKKKTKMTHIAFNQKYRIIVVGDERGHCSTLKLSPNLRKAPKRKKGEENLPPDPNFEINKLDKVLLAVREPEKLV